MAPLVRGIVKCTHHGLDSCSLSDDTPSDAESYTHSDVKFLPEQDNVTQMISLYLAAEESVESSGALRHHIRELSDCEAEGVTITHRKSFPPFLHRDCTEDERVRTLREDRRQKFCKITTKE